MGRIEWNDRLETRHPEIDEQHRTLLGAYNALHDALVQDRGRDDVGRALDGLREVTVAHFQEEEALMADGGYPGFSEHCGLHEELVAQVDDVCASFHEGRVELHAPMVGFIEVWLLEHIQEQDTRVADWLLSRP